MAYDLQCDDDYIYINRALSSGQSGELCILDNDAKIIYQKNIMDMLILQHVMKGI